MANFLGRKEWSEVRVWYSELLSQLPPPKANTFLKVTSLQFTRSIV